ncbi:MAG: YpdA family putative bacillithiol disulfide reductase [Candidatus Kapaibacterium sp.]
MLFFAPIRHNLRSTINKPLYDIVIVGAGPTGLACGLFARRAGLQHVVVDRGTLVNTIVGYPNSMTFFSTKERLSLGGVPFSSPNIRPTREEAVAYYRGVAESEQVNLLLQTEVSGLEKRGEEFYLTTSRGELRGRNVILATGYFDQTNRLGVEGEELPHVHHYYKEPYQHYNQRVLVIGGRNSAVEAALDLYRNGVHVTMVHRGEALGKSVKYWVRPDIENRISSGEIQMFWNTEVEKILRGEVILKNNQTGETFSHSADTIYAMIGYRPDEKLLQAFGIDYDAETLVPAYNPMTFETNQRNLFLAGSVACGCKTWEIFIENGREHARTVVEEITRKIAQQA